MIHNVDPHFTQWDVGRSVKVSDSNATHVHFANQGDAKAVIIELVDGSAKVPDYLLQTGKNLLAYEVLNGVTLERRSFPVRKRERPEDYVYEDDHRNYIYEWIANAEKAAEAANLATQNANEAAEKAIQAANSWVMIGDASGERMVVSDAIDQNFAGFRIYGKTTQDGVPTPDAPVDLVSVENPTIMVNDQSAFIPYTLHGIPVASGGNYTDANGQQWICDEIDFARGVYINRIGQVTLTGEESGWIYFNNTDAVNQFYLPMPIRHISSEIGAMCAYYRPHYLDKRDGNFGIIYTRSDGIAFNTNECTSVYDWRALLKERPITVLYIIPTPTETPLSAEALAAYAALHTSRGRTDISNDAGAWMKCEYFMDAKKYIDSLLVGTIVPATVE